LLMSKPLYGVDGNLLIEDLDEDHDQVQAILNDTFRYRNWITDQYTVARIMKHPQLRDEREKRRHRKYYRAKLRGRLFARRVRSAVAQDDSR